MGYTITNKKTGKTVDVDTSTEDKQTFYDKLYRKIQTKQGETTLYIDTCSYDDYDKVIRFLLDNGVEITNRNKMKMEVAAKMSKELANQMQDEIDFEEYVSIGETQLGA